MQFSECYCAHLPVSIEFCDQVIRFSGIEFMIGQFGDVDYKGWLLMEYDICSYGKTCLNMLLCS